jgi:hypothetical protein
VYFVVRVVRCAVVCGLFPFMLDLFPFNLGLIPFMLCLFPFGNGLFPLELFLFPFAQFIPNKKTQKNIWA